MILEMISAGRGVGGFSVCFVRGFSVSPRWRACCLSECSACLSRLILAGVGKRAIC